MLSDDVTHVLWWRGIWCVIGIKVKVENGHFSPWTKNQYPQILKSLNLKSWQGKYQFLASFMVYGIILCLCLFIWPFCFSILDSLNHCMQASQIFWWLIWLNIRLNDKISYLFSILFRLLLSPVCKWDF
jgi:hypothetical protein